MNGMAMDMPSPRGDELAREPLAGRVLQPRVEAPGLPASLAISKGLP
jgi:hypothetical protein